MSKSSSLAPGGSVPRACFALFLLLLAGTAVAQDPGSDPAALELLKKAEAAMARLGPVQLRVDYRVESGESVETLLADLALGSPHGHEGLPLARPVIARLDTGDPNAEPMRASFDGSMLLHQMPDRKSVWKIRFRPDGAFPALPLMMALPAGFGTGKLMHPSEGRISLGAPRKVGGVDCRVLVTTKPMPAEGGEGGEKVWSRTVAVGADDLIVRLSEAILSEGEGEARRVLFRSRCEIVGDIVRLDAEPTNFEVLVPEGWELVDATPKPPAPPKVPAGSKAPNWTLSDFEGKSHELASMRGKVVLLDFWATWCGPCKEGMPKMQALHEKYGARGLQVVGISVHEQDAAAPAKYFRERGYTYLGLTGGDEVGEAYGVEGIPHLFVIGPDGIVADQVVGMGTDLAKRLEATIEKLLPPVKR